MAVYFMVMLLPYQKQDKKSFLNFTVNAHAPENGSLLHGYVTALSKAGQEVLETITQSALRRMWIANVRNSLYIEADKELAALFQVQLLVFRFSHKEILPNTFLKHPVEIRGVLLYDKRKCIGENNNMEEKKTCFVVTPIGDENTAIRRHIDGIIDQAIIPAISKEFDVKVAHREYEVGSINDRVIQRVYDSDLVIANLTTLNPNVMFELAIRYSFGKPTIAIAEKGTKLPFDIIDENTIFYII